MVLLKVGKNITGYFYSHCRWCHLLTTGKKCWIGVRSEKWVRLENVFILQLPNYNRTSCPCLLQGPILQSQSYSYKTVAGSWKPYSWPGISNHWKPRVNKCWIYLENERHESAEELINAPTFSNACWDQDKKNVLCPLRKSWKQCLLWQWYWKEKSRYRWCYSKYRHYKDECWLKWIEIYWWDVTAFPRIAVVLGRFIH